MKKIFTLWRIITSNIMMMKKLLFSSLFLLGSLVSQAQHEYTIKGEVKGVKDGTHVSLFLTDGRVGSIVIRYVMELSFSSEMQEKAVWINCLSCVAIQISLQCR